MWGPCPGQCCGMFDATNSEWIEFALDLTSVTSREIGTALDRAGIPWSFDDDGDVQVRFRANQPPWVDAVFYEFDTVRQDFSLRGQFLNARLAPRPGGGFNLEVPLTPGQKCTAVAQKIVTIYLSPRPGGIGVQIYAAIAPLDQPRPMHIRVIPGREQVGKIERAYPGFVGRGDERSFWLGSGFGGKDVSESDFSATVRDVSLIGLQMLEGPFTGWMNTSEL